MIYTYQDRFIPPISFFKCSVYSTTMVSGYFHFIQANGPVDSYRQLCIKCFSKLSKIIMSDER